MSLLNNVQNLKFKNMDKDLKIGKTPDNCEVVAKDGTNVDFMPFSFPRDESELRFKTGEKIATYHKCINAWVMEKGLSPDLIPEIKGRPTISYEQYENMRVYARHIHERNYRWQGYELGEKDGYNKHQYDSVDAKRANRIRNDFYSLNQKLMDKMKNIAKTPTVEDVYKYSKTRGDNKNWSPEKGSGIFHITVNDVMHCLFGNVQRMKEFENHIEEKSKEDKNNDIKYFAIGKQPVTQLQIDDWKEDFQRGQFPKGFNIFHYVDYEDNCDLIRIPEKPIANEHTMTYNGEPFAKFTGICWELCAKSNIDGIPPITSDELDRIFTYPTQTTREVVKQRDDIRFGTIDELINSTNPDEGTHDIINPYLTDDSPKKPDACTYDIIKEQEKLLSSR